MSELYNLIENLCKEKGTNVTAMCKAVGMSRSPLTELKMGRSKSLSAATLSKIAAFFGVSVDYLLGNEEKPATSTKDVQDELCDTDMEIEKLYIKLKDLLTSKDIEDVKTLMKIRAELNKANKRKVELMEHLRKQDELRKAKEE